MGEHFDGEDYLAWTRSGLAHAAGVSASVIDGLTKQELFEPVKIPASAVVAAPDLQPASHRLSDEQTVAAEALVAEAQTGEFSCTLLDGVTGSGKTEVYFEAGRYGARKQPPGADSAAGNCPDHVILGSV